MRQPPTLSTALEVPFLDLGRTHAPLKERLLERFGELIDSNAFLNGPEVDEFEQAFARYCGTRHCVAVASGLDALRLGLLAAGIEPGDGVVVPANTFVATLEAVTQAGGRPILVDVSEGDWNVDVAAARAAAGEARFAMPVHLYGQMADMKALGELELVVVEDACQAHGAERDGIAAGTAGIASAFSHYPGKNLGAMGDAGALVTDDEGIDELVRALREHGQRRKYHHDLEGYTARLDTNQAIVLLEKLPYLDGWNEERAAAAAFYAAELEGVGDLRLAPVAPNSRHVWHLYVVRTADPQALAAFLADRRIATGRHYPQPVHLSGAYAHLGYAPGDFPVTEAIANECLSLPIFPGMTDEELNAVVGAVRAYFDG